MIKIDTADVIFHRPSRETWLVAYVRGEHLCACGWPESLAALSDCLLVEKASAEERMELLRSMASGSGGDSRNRYARAALAAQPAPSVMDFASEIAKIIRHAREGNRPGVESYALLLCDKIDAAEPRLSRYLRRVIAGDDGERVYPAAQPAPDYRAEWERECADTDAMLLHCEGSPPSACPAGQRNAPSPGRRRGERWPL